MAAVRPAASRRPLPTFAARRRGSCATGPYHGRVFWRHCMSLSERHLADIRRTFSNYKALGERAMAQASDADLHRLLDPDANSIALIVKHLSGNLRSRLSDFLTTDGEKPDRNRDDEF